MKFENISYTSTILWHFVRGNGRTYDSKEDDSLDILTNYILKDDATGRLVAIPPKKEKFHKRNFSLEKAMVLSDIDRMSDWGSMAMPSAGEVYSLKEPRAICFADIPINSLPIHIDGYFGIGLGFRKEILVAKIDDLKPVDYYPKKTIFTLKNACVGFKDTKYQFDLRKYSKIPSEDEPFEQIYHEREWRTFDKLDFNSNELAVMFFPSKRILTKSLKNKKIRKLIDLGVGYITGEDLYTAKRELK